MDAKSAALYEFDYSVWNPDTVIDLVTVPWDSGYRDLVRFESGATRTAWFDARRAEGRAVRLTNLVYLKYGEPVRLPLPFSQCNQFNYLIARNPVQPVPTRSQTPTRVPDTFYYFITSVEYLAPNCTALTVQLDVWQTYGNRVTFGRSYITRGHIAIANENCTMATRADYLLEAEGVEYGDEYDTVNSQFVSFADPQAPPYLMVLATTALQKPFGDVSAPKLTTATGGTAAGLVSGTGVWFVRIQDVDDFFTQLSDAPWVSQGIISCTVLPYRMCSFDATREYHLGGVSSNVRIYRAREGVTGNQRYLVASLNENFRIPARYAGLLKLYNSPYCYMEVTTYQGNPMMLKPEHWRVTDGTAYLASSYSLLPAPVMKFWPENYNFGNRVTPVTVTTVDGAGNETIPPLTGGEFLDMQTEMGDFVQVPVVNNMYMNYLASTVNQRAYQFSAADWAQQKSLSAAANAYNVTLGNMGAASENQQVANNLAYQSLAISQEQNLWNGIKGVGGNLAGAVGSAAGGNWGGAVSGVAGAVVAGVDAAAQSEWMARSTANQVGAANATLANTQGAQRYAADTNLAYANYAAKGDYQQAIQGINASVSDAQLAQPSVSGQFGGNGFMWANGLVGLTIKWKRIKPQYIAQLGDYFMRYGYYVNRFLIPPADLKCMSKFTYWQMQEAVVYGALPEEFRQTVRGIFETGCTVWSSPDDIGRIDYADNEPVKGVKY